MFPVLPQTRASCAAQRLAEELYGGTGALSRWTLAAITALSVVAVGACGPSEPAAGPLEDVSDVVVVDTSLRFGDSVDSLEELGLHVLDALTSGDRDALEDVRLTEYEHNEVVWPELPAAAPEVNYPVDYAWENIENRNRRGITRLLPFFGGGDHALQSVECRGERETFDTFHVDTDCWVVFSSNASLELREVQLFRDVLVRGGGMKIFRYYDEEPRPYRGVGTG